MQESQHEAQVLASLRDFFIAKDGVELEAAAGSLPVDLKAAVPAVSDWESVEFDFNRFFVGPRVLAAPPYASVYLSPEPQVMGEAALDARRVYEALGLQSPFDAQLPDDHLSLELDALRIMQGVLSHTPSEPLKALRDCFVHEHLNAWVPLFARRVRSVAPEHTVIRFMADAVERCVESVAESKGRF
ncbi:molecular chaperone TorD family protein [Desulfovibrio aminophilus]|uniref:molecular chaperone TorD family protein n=1 Tax=Desulfovibrio aminophilus TaxID=81425 RepID=UPI0033973686